MMKFSASSRPVHPAITRSASTFNRATRVLWLAAVFLLPLTSFPLLAQLSGGPTVAPVSVALFLVLVLVWLIPHVLRGGALPFDGLPLLAFGLAAGISWAGSFFINMPPFHDKGILTEAPEALLTLAMALATFYLASAWLFANKPAFQLTLQLINWSGLLVIVWSLSQAYFAFFQNNAYPNEFVDLQHLFVFRRMPLFYSRVTGFAYEPSWLAHQLNMVYIPLWLSAFLNGFTAHHRRLGLLTAETLLLAGGILILLLSFSRVGWLTFLLVIAVLVLAATLRLSAWLHRRLVGLARSPWMVRLSSGPVITLVVLGLSFLVFAGLTFAALYVGSKIDPRLARIFEEQLALDSFYALTNQLAFAERVIYWAAGWRIFSRYPILGVGPGNAGFFFPSELPAFGFNLWEIKHIFYTQSYIPNTKSMWVRILAETGLVGFSLFITWYYTLWRSSWLAQHARDPVLRVVGLAGLLVLVGFLIEGFSIDSFALPYFWFAAGLASAAGALTRREPGQAGNE